jgi:hypothetical protein
MENMDDMESMMEDMDMANSHLSFWNTTVLSEQALPVAATDLDSTQGYCMVNLQTLGRILIPQIGLFDLDDLLSRDIDDFFDWYSSQSSVPGVSALRFDLMELESGPNKYVTVTKADSQASDAFCGLKIIIKNTFLALKEANPGLGIFRVHITPDSAYGVQYYRHGRWMQGVLRL